MGNSFSQNNSVYLQTDKQTYSDGDVVQCVICLNIADPVAIGSIDVKLAGYEKTSWTKSYTVSNGKESRTVTEWHGGKYQIMDVKQPLPGTSRYFERGQYQWQVAFALPEGIPSTTLVGPGLTWKSWGDMVAKVIYKVKIEVTLPGKSKPALKHKQPLTVHSRLPPPEKSPCQSAERDLVRCYCCKNGSISANAWVEKNQVYPGETVQVLLELDNRSKLAVKHVKASLKQEVTAMERPYGSGGSQEWKGEEYATTEHPGVQPFTTLDGSMARRYEIQLPPPDKLQPSVHGAILMCRYFAKLKLQMGVGVSDIKLKVPIIVLHPQQALPLPAATPEEPFYFEPPPFWQPIEVHNPMALDVPSAPPLPPAALQPDGPFWVRANSGRNAAVAV